VLTQTKNRDLKVEAATWLDRTGPFLGGDGISGPDDYFEVLGIEVTDGGLGEAARQIRAGSPAASFSFPGGKVDFAASPLVVTQLLPDGPLISLNVQNVWTVKDLRDAAVEIEPIPYSWRELVLYARNRFPYLVIPDSVYRNNSLAREPFDPVIRDRALFLLDHLNTYMSHRSPDGVEGSGAKEIIDHYFVGENALFSGESPSNQRTFSEELMFKDPSEPREHIFAHWHGKISHRFYRVHFEWPVPAGQAKLKVLYLGPKITKR
jgi:hypothetical protein